MKISILTDNPKSWFIPFGIKLKELLTEMEHQVSYVYNANDIKEGDICFILSCTKLVNNNILLLNRNNIVVHASDLPSGKGFSPLQWQILEGKNEICLTLFEVVDKVDAGPYYLKNTIKFNGDEFYDELRATLAEKIIQMCVDYVKGHNILLAKEQHGSESFYRRRGIQDDEVDINKTIKELFNHFRIADNENYPLFFKINGKKFFLKVYPENN